MLVNMQFLFAIQSRGGIVLGCVFDRLSCQIDRDFGVQPIDMIDPLGNDEYLVSEPPVTRIDDEVTNRRGFLIDNQSLDMSDIPVGRMHVVPHDRIATAKIRVILLLAHCTELAARSVVA